MSKHDFHILPPAIQRAKKLARLMDSAFTIPIIRKRVGLDPVLGLIPGGGDLVSTILAMYPLWVAYELGLPQAVIYKMAGNVLLDALIGTVPVAGDVFDAFWKANIRNLEILEKAYLHQQKQQIFEGGPVVDTVAEESPAMTKKLSGTR